MVARWLSVHWLSFLVLIQNIVILLPSVLEYLPVGRIAGFDFFPPLHSDHAPFYANDCIWSWIIRRGQRVTPILFQKNMVTNLDQALLCESALISISFHLHLLSLVPYMDWVTAFSFLGDDPFRQLSSHLSAEHKLVRTLSSQDGVWNDSCQPSFEPLV